MSLATVLLAAAHLHLTLRQLDTGQAHAEACLSLCAEHRFQDLLEQLIFHRGWALALQGHTEQGLTQMRACIGASQAAGVRWMAPSFLAQLAHIYLSLGRCEEGLEAISEALALVEATGERHYEAEVHRLKGELLFIAQRKDGTAQQARQTAEVEACFQHALAISRRQMAKALELRAAMSLYRLWQHQGRQQPAHQLLSEVYAWFTEGFDMIDLQEAKALLESQSV
jgi:predicted ATPase